MFYSVHIKIFTTPEAEPFFCSVSFNLAHRFAKEKRVIASAWLELTVWVLCQETGLYCMSYARVQQVPLLIGHKIQLCQSASPIWRGCCTYVYAQPNTMFFVIYAGRRGRYVERNEPSLSIHGLSRHAERWKWVQKPVGIFPHAVRRAPLSIAHLILYFLTCFEAIFNTYCT